MLNWQMCQNEPKKPKKHLERIRGRSLKSGKLFDVPLEKAKGFRPCNNTFSPDPILTSLILLQFIIYWQVKISDGAIECHLKASTLPVCPKLLSSGSCPCFGAVICLVTGKPDFSKAGLPTWNEKEPSCPFSSRYSLLSIRYF